MLKALKSCLIILSSIILLSTSAYALTSTEFLHKQEDNIVKMCEDLEAKRQAVSKDNPFVFLFRRPGHYECGITGFYALHQVIKIILSVEKDTDDYKFLNKLLTKYYIEDYETYNFMYIHLDFERYLEEKSSD